MKIVLSEAPNGGFTTDSVDVTNGTATKVVAGIPFLAKPATDASEIDALPSPTEGDYAPFVTDGGTVPAATGRDMMYYPYLVTINPDLTKDDVTIKVKDFMDTVLANTYNPYDTSDGTANANAIRRQPGEYKYSELTRAIMMINGRHMLNVKIEKLPGATPAKRVSLRVKIADDLTIPAGGYGILLKTDSDQNDDNETIHANTGVIVPPKKTTDDKRTPAQKLYNTPLNDKSVGLPDLEVYFLNGVVIDLVKPSGEHHRCRSCRRRGY